MSELYDHISTLIKEITYIKSCRRVAIYPLNDAGLIAKSILKNCYGYSPILVDDELTNYNRKIISVEKYKQIADFHDVILICVTDPVNNQECVIKFKQAGIRAKIKNILSLPITYRSEKMEYFKKLKKLLLVREAVGFNLKRYGRHHDGGYVMLDDFRECHIAYSFGINDDISWDEQIAENGIDVFCYDHTINALPKENPRLHFNKIGIGVRDSLGESLLSLDTILDLNKCQNEKNMILKMDTEGAEWGFIRDISSETLSKFSQITFEFHSLAGPYFLSVEETLAIFEKLNKTHQLVWLHANNFGSVEQSGDIIIPDTIEVTYANKNQYRFKSCEYNCPLAIDEPNHSVRPDVELDNFGEITNETQSYCENQNNSLKFFEIDTDNNDIETENSHEWINNQILIIETQNAKIDEQSNEIERQNQIISEQANEIEQQNQKINEQTNEIEQQNQKINEQTNEIERLNLKIDEQTNEIEEQNSRLSENLELFSQYKNQIKKMSNDLNDNNERINSMQLEIDRKNAEIDSLYHSKSWKITAPLRKIFSFIRRLLKGKSQT